MAHRTLTQDELAYLDFYVGTYTHRQMEIYVELLDHLASSIEAQWVAWPQRPFAEALQRALASLGPQGMAGVVERRLNAELKRSARRWREGLRRAIVGLSLPATLLIAWSLHRLLLAGVRPAWLGLGVQFFFLLVYFAMNAWLGGLQSRHGRRYIELEAPLRLAVMAFVPFQMVLLAAPLWAEYFAAGDYWVAWGVALLLAACIFALFVLFFGVGLEALRDFRRYEALFGERK